MENADSLKIFSRVRVKFYFCDTSRSVHILLEVFTMRNFLQHILFFVTAAMLFAACEKDDTLILPDISDTSSYPEAEAGEVRLVLADGSTRAPFEGMTRAMLAEDGKNLLWQSGDRFRLYAHNGDGSNAFVANPYIDFSYWVNTTTAGRSFFRGKMDADMAAGSYTYYAVYPHSTPVSGTVATFTLPAVQDGTYGKTDFMVAKSTASALQRITDSDPTTPEPMNNISLTLKHQLHAMRFEIPSTGALSSGVRRVHILFSEAVVGDIAVDMASGSVTTSNTSNKITVDFGEGNEKQAGDKFWVMTLPQAAFSRAVDIRFEDSAGNYSTRQLVTFPTSQQYTAGRLTPVKINVPNTTSGISSLHCTITNYAPLGEPITNLHLTLPTGYYFTDYTSYRNGVADGNGEYVYALFDDMFDNTLRNSNLQLDYESKNAFVPTTVVLGNTVNISGRTNYPLTTPYLFEENFNNVESFSNKDAHATSNTGSHSYTFVNLKGWTGGRVGGEAGKSVRLACHRETSAQYDARLDSPVMSYLKDGKNVKVRVSYNYGMDQDGGGVWTTYVGQTCYEGRTTDTSALKSGDETGTFESEFFIDKSVNDNNGSYSSLPYSRSFEFTGCTNGTRISWRTRTEYDAGLNNNTCWLYIDNVRVSIAQ